MRLALSIGVDANTVIIIVIVLMSKTVLKPLYEFSHSFLIYHDKCIELLCHFYIHSRDLNAIFAGLKASKHFMGVLLQKVFRAHNYCL